MCLLCLNDLICGIIHICDLDSQVRFIIHTTSLFGLQLKYSCVVEDDTRKCTARSEIPGTHYFFEFETEFEFEFVLEILSVMFYHVTTPTFILVICWTSEMAVHYFGFKKLTYLII